MSSVNVLVFSHDGSTRYRLLYPAEQLAKAGHDVLVYDLADGVDETTVRVSDVVVVSRPVWPRQADLVEQLAALGIRVVVDMDDGIEHLVPEHSMYGFDATSLHRALAVAHRLVVTTPALAMHYLQYRPVVVPNLTPDFMLSIRSADYDKPRPVIGWFGGLGSHPNDLQQTGMGVWAAMQAAPADFGFAGTVWRDNVSNMAEVRARLGIPLRHPIHWWPFTHDMHTLWSQVFSFDVGIVPLQTCMFNAMKSRLKGIEYAALGVPFVASPMPEYRELSDHGVGLLAETPVQWKRLILRLLRDQDLRLEMIVNGRNYARANAYSRRSSVFWEAWTA